MSHATDGLAQLRNVRECIDTARRALARAVIDHERPASTGESARAARRRRVRGALVDAFMQLECATIAAEGVGDALRAQLAQEPRPTR